MDIPKEDLLAAIAAKCKKSDKSSYTMISSQILCDKVQNFDFDLRQVCVKATRNSDGSLVEAEFVVKSLPLDPSSVQRLSGDLVRERRAYEELLPCLQALRQTAKLNHLSVPDCYFVSNKLLIMEDMTKKGFRPIKSCEMTNNHVDAALGQLATFHATSYKYLQISTQSYWQIKSWLTSEKSMISLVSVMIEGALLIFDRFGNGNSKLIQRLNQFNASWLEKINMIEDDAHAQLSTSLLTLVHNDFWYGNILFRQTGDVCIEACVLDFQTIRLARPVVDLVHFIFTSTSSNCWQGSQLDEIVDKYHQKLCLELSSLGCPLYTKGDLRADLEHSFPLGFVFGIMQAQLDSLCTRDGVDWTKLFGHVLSEHEKSRYKEALLTKANGNDDTFRKRVLNLVYAADANKAFLT